MDLKSKPLEKILSKKTVDQIVLSKFFKKDHLLEHQQEGYARFIDQFLPMFFKEQKKLFLAKSFDKKKNQMVTYNLSFGKFSLNQVSYTDRNGRVNDLTNQLCYMYNMSRQLKLCCEVKIIAEDEQGNVETIGKKKLYQIGRIPLLVNSRFDKLKELEGYFYFIINGSARTLYNVVEQKPLNQTYKKLSNKAYLTIKKDPYTGFGGMEIGVDYEKKDFTVSFAKNPRKLSLIHLLRLYDVKAQECFSFLNRAGVLDVSLLAVIEKKYLSDEAQIVDQFYTTYLKRRDQNAILTIQEKKQKIIEFLDSYYLKNHQLSDRPLIEQRRLKTLESLTLLVKCITYYNKEQEKFRDSLSEKRILSTYQHFERCFRESFDMLIDKARGLFLKEQLYIKKSADLSHLFRVEILKKYFKVYLIETKSGLKESQSNLMVAVNDHQYISSQRKVVSRLKKTLLHTSYRTLNPTKVGRVCPISTPYSRSVGLVEYLALGTKLSLENKQIDQLLSSTVDYEFSPCAVYLNDRMRGYLKGPLDSMIRKLKTLKKKSKVSLSYNLNGQNLMIRSVDSRILKPFYVVEKGEVLIDTLKSEEIESLTLSQLIDKNYLTYLDVEQQLNSKVAITREDVTKETEVLYLEPSAYMSYCASSIPYMNLNAAHRASLTYRLVSQSLGGKGQKSKYLYNCVKSEYLTKTDPSIVATYFDRYRIAGDNIGKNMILAFYNGQNEEDAVEVNRSAVERGVLDHVVMKKIKLESKALYQGYDYDYMPFEGRYPGGAVDKDGLPILDKIVENSPVIYRRKIMEKFEEGLGEAIYSPQSSFKVNQVSVDWWSKDSCNIEVSFKAVRTLKEGNKFGTRSGLKGVVSVLKTQLDMDIPQNGVYPSVFFSNHVINSRMTLSPLLEACLSKALVLKGQRKVQSCFSNPVVQKETTDQIEQIFKAHNMDLEGRDYWTDRESGQRVSLFMGPVKMLLLEHHSLDKAYYRTGHGGRSFKTRQPGEGRSVKGGLRMGEMECNALTEHVAAHFIKDKMGVDLQRVKICSRCQILSPQLLNSVDFCKKCLSRQYLTEVQIPYAFLLLTRILRAAHIDTFFEVGQGIQ